MYSDNEWADAKVFDCFCLWLLQNELIHRILVLFIFLSLAYFLLCMQCSEQLPGYRPGETHTSDHGVDSGRPINVRATFS